jgi:hypothetical protein
MHFPFCIETDLQHLNLNRNHGGITSVSLVRAAQIQGRRAHPPKITTVVCADGKEWSDVGKSSQEVLLYQQVNMRGKGVAEGACGDATSRGPAQVPTRVVNEPQGCSYQEGV